MVPQQPLLRTGPFGTSRALGTGTALSRPASPTGERDQESGLT